MAEVNALAAKAQALNGKLAPLETALQGIAADVADPVPVVIPPPEPPPVP